MGVETKMTLKDGQAYSFLGDEGQNGISTPDKIKTNIEEYITSKNLHFRIATFNDMEAVSSFQKEVFSPNTSTLETEYELYRIIKFGYVLLIEDAENKIAGCYSTIHYANAGNIGYGIRVGVSPQIAGHNFAARLAQYATVLAFENGCQHFKALTSPVNFKSVTNCLNHIGYYCSGFYRNLPSFGPRFEISFPLTLETLNNRMLDMKKVVDFIRDSTPRRDYLLVDPYDLDIIESTYSSTEFRIIAFLKPGTIDDKSYFLLSSL